MNPQDVAQRTPEWHAQRNGRITGSRVGSILGLNKYQTADGVMRDMVRAHFGDAPEFTGNEATEYGTKHEPDAIAEYAFSSAYPVIETGLHVHPEYDWLAASPDGLVGPKGMIEVKCPMRAKYRSAQEKPEYVAQMQLQMAVTNRDWCDFVIWRDGEELIVDCVERDRHWLDRMYPALRAFIDDYRATIADPERASRHRSPLERADAAWRDAAIAYAAAKRAAELADLSVTEARDKLIALAPSGASGCGVHVSQAMREGGIDYARAVKTLLPGVSLDEYRKASSTYYTVRISP